MKLFGENHADVAKLYGAIGLNYNNLNDGKKAIE